MIRPLMKERGLQENGLTAHGYRRYMQEYGRSYYADLAAIHADLGLVVANRAAYYIPIYVFIGTE